MMVKLFCRRLFYSEKWLVAKNHSRKLPYPENVTVRKSYCVYLFSSIIVFGNVRSNQFYVGKRETKFQNKLLYTVMTIMINFIRHYVYNRYIS